LNQGSSHGGKRDGAGRKPKPGRHGGRREGAGRKLGVPNKATADIKALARDYGPAAIRQLAELAGLTSRPGVPNVAVRVAAMKELLDRGYGKATQLIGSDEERPLAIAFEWAPALNPQSEDAESAAVLPAAGPLTIDVELEDAGDNGSTVFLWKGEA
jgi:hypothetical protein